LAREAGIDQVRLDTWLLGLITLRREEMDRLEWVANRAESARPESQQLVSHAQQSGRQSDERTEEKPCCREAGTKKVAGKAASD